MMMQGPERPEVNGGGKIIMPPSALESLSRLNISYPMLFKIENKDKQRSSHTGVLEFIADEGKGRLFEIKNLKNNFSKNFQKSVKKFSCPVG